MRYIYPFNGRTVNKTYEEFILYNSMLSVVFLLEHWVDYTGKEDKPNGRDILYQFVPATNLPPLH